MVILYSCPQKPEKINCIAIKKIDHTDEPLHNIKEGIDEWGIYV